MKRIKYVACVLALVVGITGCTKADPAKEAPEATTQTESVPITKETQKDSTQKPTESDSETDVTETSDSATEIEETKQKTTTESGSTLQSPNISKEEYINSLQHAYDMEATINDANTQLDMNEISSEALALWDEELNKIYQILMNSLTEDQQKTLEQEESAWIQEKEQEVAAIAEEFKGGSMEFFQSNMTALNMTKNRTLELINQYYNDGSITSEQAIELVKQSLGEQSPGGNYYTFSFQGIENIGGTNYFSIRIAELVDGSSSYIGQKFVTMDGATIADGTQQDDGSWVIQ